MLSPFPSSSHPNQHRERKMVRLISSIFVLALAAVQAFARPGGVEHTTTAKKKPTNFNATWECNYKYQGLWDNYRLVGRDWGINETMLERAVNKAGIVTKFKYSKWERDGHEGFNTTVSLGCEIGDFEMKVFGVMGLIFSIVPPASRFCFAAKRVLQSRTRHQPFHQKREERVLEGRAVQAWQG